MQRTILIIITMFCSLCVSASDATASKYRYIYIEAVRQQDMGNLVEAFELFRRCVELRPDAAEANHALGTYYMVLEKDTIGMAYLKRAVDIEPDNSEFVERLARTYLYRNMYDETVALYEKLISMHPERSEYLEVLAEICEKQRDYPNLLKTLDRYEVQEGKSVEIALSKMQVYNMMGDTDGAYNELKGLVDAHPYDMNFRVMLGNWLLGNGRRAEAYDAFQQVLKEEPGNYKCQMSLMDYYNADGQPDKADKMLYEMLVNPQTEPDVRVSLIRDWIIDGEKNGRDSARVVEMFNRVLAIPQTTTDVAEMKAAYLTLKNAPADSIKAEYERILEVAPENVGARLQLIQMMWNDSIDEKVVNECRKATEYIPDEPLLYYYLGMAQYINEHYADAVSSLHRGVATFKDDTSDETKRRVFMMLGDALLKTKHSKEGYAMYDSCLVYAPDDNMCLNNYAYFLSCDNVDLKKAEKMSYRAITAEANNATYLDTYAWILYKQKRYDEARIYIERAIQCDTVAEESNGELLDHAGDIYFMLGLKDKALGMWQKALLLGVENEVTLRKKIKKKKIVK